MTKDKKIEFLKQLPPEPEVGVYPAMACLTRREREVMHLIMDGLSSKEISDIFSVSESTIETHRGSIINKYEALNMNHAISTAFRLELKNQGKP